MNHQELFNNLMDLTNNEAFYFVDAVHAGKTYRVFNYRLASYSDFLLPDAFNARGTTFRIDENGPELASLPPVKFFNLFENSFTMNIGESDVYFSMDKLDGSLISTVATDNWNNFCLKSKTSFQSGQAQMATDLLNADPELKELLKFFTLRRYTVNMELTSPLNRIVLPYQRPELTILNLRSLETGETIYAPDIGKRFVVDNKYIVPYYDGFPDQNGFQHYVDNATGTEGFVCVTQAGTVFKLKNDWYCKLHHTKDSVTVPRRLYEACLAGASDDLLAMFHDDAAACNMINCMQELAFHHYNHVVKTVETYYEDNKALDRKSYAIKAQNDTELAKLGVFSLAMNLYVGKEVKYEEFLTKHNETVLRLYDEKIALLHLGVNTDE